MNRSLVCHSKTFLNSAIRSSTSRVKPTRSIELLSHPIHPFTSIHSSGWLATIKHPCDLLALCSTRRLSQTTANDPWKMMTDIEYRDLKPITETPSDDVLLIDVREEGEVIQGNIPSSVNMPMSRFEKLLDLHPDDFRRSLGFSKPSVDQKIVFYCRSGARSALALEIAKLKGFKNLRNYKGSWLDWVEKERIS